jgi:hypothetical protein
MLNTFGCPKVKISTTYHPRRRNFELSAPRVTDWTPFDFICGVAWRIQFTVKQQKNFIFTYWVTCRIKRVVQNPQIPKELRHETEPLVRRCPRKSLGDLLSLNFMWCWPCISIYACNETNLMHYLSSVYSVTIPLHVSGLLVAHHQEVTMYIYKNWLTVN